MDETFARDIKAGLTAIPKFLFSKYFYDHLGSQLFQEIMQLEEYYLTDLEEEIFKEERSSVLELFQSDKRPVKLIEFGAGDGTKTGILLSHFLEAGLPIDYIPIDISQQAIDDLVSGMAGKLPGLSIQPVTGDYLESLEQLDCCAEDLKMVLFLGSNIGNFTPEESVEFLKKITDRIDPGDMILVGFDLKKDPETILQAYNDKKGITSAFNLNLLTRINRELGGNFDVGQFYHYPVYDPISGAARSYLISMVEQSVYLSHLDLIIEFAANEPVYMEISQKYDLPMITEIGGKAGLSVRQVLTDKKKYFADVIFCKNDD
jgi:dimethylhistidine N-methyltransferase